MTGYKSKQKAAQDKLAHMTFEERCRLSEQCLPEAPYREMLIALHDEMLKSLAQPEQEQGRSEAFKEIAEKVKKMPWENDTKDSFIVWLQGQA